MELLLSESRKVHKQNLIRFLVAAGTVPYPQPFRTEVMANVTFLFEDDAFCREDVRLMISIDKSHATVSIYDSLVAPLYNHHAVYTTLFHNFSITRNHRLCIGFSFHQQETGLVWINRILSADDLAS